MARNVYEGKGFSTSVLRPISYLAFQHIPHPEYTRPPLYPYLLALFFRFFGANDFAAVLLNGLFYILLVVMTFLFSLDFSGSKLMAMTVSAITALSAWFLRMSIMGSTDIVFAALFMTFLYTLFRYHERPFAIGLFAGLLYLTRLNAAFIGAALVLAEYNPLVRRENWKRAALFCIGVLVAASPVLVRNILQGSALSAINSYSFFVGGRSLPGYFYITQLNQISGWEFIKSHPGEIFELILIRSAMLVKGFPQDFGIFLLLLMAAGLFLSVGGGLHERIKRFIIYSVFIQTFFLILTNAEARYYGFLVPPLVLFAIVSLKELKNRPAEAVVCSLVIIFVIYSSISFWRGGKPLNHYQILGKEVQAKTSKDDIIISDLAWAMSWYGDRKAVWLTYDLDTMDKISRTIPINYALISFETVIHPLVPYKDGVWQKLLLSPGSYNVSGFDLVEIYYVGKQPIAALYKVQREIKSP